MRAPKQGGRLVVLKVIQWATGGVGKAAIEGILRHPELDLVGCWVHSPDKAGRDVGEILGVEFIGVRTTNTPPSPASGPTWTCRSSPAVRIRTSGGCRVRHRPKQLEGTEQDPGNAIVF
jgi:hypothetical protein